MISGGKRKKKRKKPRVKNGWKRSKKDFGKGKRLFDEIQGRRKDDSSP